MAEHERAGLHRQFVERFADAAHRAAVMGREELARLAGRLGTTLPAAFVEFVCQHGAVRCVAAGEGVMARRRERGVLRQFLTPEEMVRRSEELWCQTLPVDVYTFASDGAGDAFCFHKSREAEDDARVLFLWREGERLLELDEGFDALLRRHLEHAAAGGGSEAGSGEVGEGEGV
jgi:hypothetical protein